MSTPNLAGARSGANYRRWRLIILRSDVGRKPARMIGATILLAKSLLVLDSSNREYPLDNDGMEPQAQKETAARGSKFNSEFHRKPGDALVSKLLRTIW